MDLIEEIQSPPSSPRRQATGIFPIPTSPADDYRRRRRESHMPEPGSPQARPEPTNESPIRSPPSKTTRRDGPPCSVCSCSCIHARNIGLGARVAFALVARKFSRGLAGELVACESCAKALARAGPLLRALQAIIVTSPTFYRGGAALRITNLRGGVQLLFSEFKKDPRTVEAQLRYVSHENGWIILPALCGVQGCGILQLLKDSSDNKFGRVCLCDNPVDESTGWISVHDTIDKRIFKVAHWRLIPLPDPHVAPGIAAAPHAAFAQTARLTRSLQDAVARVSDLEDQKVELSNDLHSFQKEAKMQLHERSKEIEILGATLLVAKQRAGHAYNQGMHRSQDLERDLQDRDAQIAALQEEISKSKAKSKLQKAATKTLQEAELRVAAQEARGLLVLSNAQAEVMGYKKQVTELQAEILKLQELAARSKRERKEALQYKDKAAVDVACALRIRANSDQEVLSTREANDKLQRENDRLRMELNRLRMREPRTFEPHEHETRGAAQRHSSLQASQLTSAAAIILRDASELVSSLPEMYQPHESLVGSHIEFSDYHGTEPGVLALKALIRKLCELMGGREIASALFSQLPLSSFAIVGEALNKECRGLSKVYCTSTLSQRFEGASTGVRAFFHELFLTQSEMRGQWSVCRQHTVDARCMVVLSLVGFSLNPQDCNALQRPLAQMIAQGKVIELHNLTNSMGLSVSHCDWLTGASTRRAHSREIIGVSLQSWSAACEGTDLWVKIHLDNYDKDEGNIHMIMVGLTRCDPPSSRRFVQRRFHELEAEDLFKQSVHERHAVRLEDLKCVAKADAAAAVPEARLLVLNLLADSERALQTEADVMAERLSRRPGRKGSLPSQAAACLPDKGEVVKAQRSLCVKDEHDKDFIVSIGNELTVFEIFPDRELAVVQIGAGSSAQCAWVPTSVFVPIGPEVQSAEKEYTDRTQELREREARQAADADMRVQRAVNAAFGAKTHLPRPSLPLTAVHVGLFHGLASNRDDCHSAIAAAAALLHAVVPTAQFLLSVDGQPFGNEHKYRDALREKHQKEMSKIDLELSIQSIDAQQRDYLQRARAAAEFKRDSVSNLPPVELGTLHAQFAGVRACFKKNSEFAYRGLCDRMGLGHAFENIAKCASGYLTLALDFFRVIRQSWIMEVKEIMESMNSEDRDVLRFIASASPISSTLDVCHRALFFEPGAVVNLRASDRMSGSLAKELQIGALKELSIVVATGGCPNYVKFLAWALRQERTSSEVAQQILAVNANTTVRETGRSFGSDEFLESHFIKGTSAALGHVHRCNVKERSAELNATLGSTHQVQKDLRPRCSAFREPRRASSLNQDAVVAIVRASIRKCFHDPIIFELGTRHGAHTGQRVGSVACSHGSAEAHARTSSGIVLARIPTREEEHGQDARASATSMRSLNRNFLNVHTIATERLLAAAKWSLRKSIGGRYEVSDGLKAPGTVEYFEKNNSERLAHVKKTSAKALALIALMSKDRTSTHKLETPASLVVIMDGVPFMNSAPKSNIRLAIRSAFKTSSLMGASAWAIGLGNSRIRISGGLSCEVAKVDHLILDIPFLLRRYPPPRPMSAGESMTGADVVLRVLAYFMKAPLQEHAKVSWVEDLSGDLAKLPTERKRDVERKRKSAPSGSSRTPATPHFSLEAIFEREPHVAVLYGDRKWRREWQESLRKILVEESWSGARDHALGEGRGVALFSGVGGSEDERKCTVALVYVSGNGRELHISEPSEQREDTQCVLEACASLQQGHCAEIWAEDTDFLLIGLLAVHTLQTASETPTLGKLLVHTSAQDVDDGNGRQFQEQIFCCNDLASAVSSHPSLAALHVQHRVPSVVVACVMLGGDTTSYMYHPYVKSLTLYLEHAGAIGSLIRDATASESDMGWSVVLDREAVHRFIKVLYICRFPSVLPGWTSMQPSERVRAVSEIEYEQLEKLVARRNFPQTTSFMPNPMNLRWHMLRTQQRVQTWKNATRRTFPDLPLAGFVVFLRPRAGLMCEAAAEVRLEEPTRAEIGAHADMEVERVEPLVDLVSRTLSFLFGEVNPAEVLLRKKRTSSSRAPRVAANTGPLLAGARERLKPGSKGTPTVPQMKAVVLAYKKVMGAGPRQIMEIRSSMKGKIETTAAFKAVLEVCGADGPPWGDMGAPEELPHSLGVAQTLNESEDSDSEDGGGSGTGGGGMLGGENRDSSEEEMETSELEAIGHVLQGMAESIGADADEAITEVENAVTAEELSEVLESGLRRSARARVEPKRFDL